MSNALDATEDHLVWEAFVAAQESEADEATTSDASTDSGEDSSRFLSTFSRPSAKNVCCIFFSLPKGLFQGQRRDAFAGNALCTVSHPSILSNFQCKNCK